MKTNSTSLFTTIIAVLSVMGISLFMLTPVFDYGNSTFRGIDLFVNSKSMSFTFFAILYVTCTAAAAVCLDNSKAVNIIRNILMSSSSLTFVIHILCVFKNPQLGEEFSKFGVGFWLPAVIVVINLILASQIKPDQQEEDESETEPN